MKAAELMGDKKKMLLCIKGKDLVAMKIKYHRSCYRNYARKNTFEIGNGEHRIIDESIFDKAFEDLPREIQQRVI